MAAPDGLNEMVLDVPREEALTLAKNEGTDPEVLDQIARTHAYDEEILRAVVYNPVAMPSTLEYLAKVAPPVLAEAMAQDGLLLSRYPFLREALKQNPALSSGLKVPLRERKEEPPRRGEAPKKSLQQIIKELTIGQKLALAKRGNKEARMLLVKDPNEMVALEVVSNPRITDPEILAISQMRDVSEKVLRAIASNKRYRANRQVMINLLHNPKTPVGVSLGLGVSFLSDRELQDLSKNRDIPVVVSRAARAVLDKRKRGPVTPGH